MTIEDRSLSPHGYLLMPITTSYLVCYNSECDVQRYFEVFYLCWWRGAYDHRRPITECPWLPIVSHSNQLFTVL